MSADDLDETGKHPWQTWPDPIIRFEHVDASGTIRYVGDGFLLEWNDGVVNEWTETWPRLDVAVVRLALLMACGATDWERGFATHEGEFYQRSTEFIAVCRAFFDQHMT